jgi:hypothetical protein
MTWFSAKAPATLQDVLNYKDNFMTFTEQTSLLDLMHHLDAEFVRLTKTIAEWDAKLNAIPEIEARIDNKIKAFNSLLASKEATTKTEIQRIREASEKCRTENKDWYREELAKEREIIPKLINAFNELKNDFVETKKLIQDHADKKKRMDEDLNQFRSKY